MFEIKVQYQIPTLHNKSNNKGCYTFSKKLKLTYIGNLAKPFKTNFIKEIESDTYRDLLVIVNN